MSSGSFNITLLLWEPYPSHHNGLFSPLLVLRDFAASWTIAELSKQYETYYLFYVTLSFLCNIICLPNIRACIFISDPFRGHNSYLQTIYLQIIYIWYICVLAWWLECLSMALETWVQSQAESYQRLKKWYLMPPCLTLSIIRYWSRVKWSNPGNGIAPSLVVATNFTFIYV